jgi:hypothetical protein
MKTESQLFKHSYGRKTPKLKREQTVSERGNYGNVRKVTRRNFGKAEID